MDEKTILDEQIEETVAEQGEKELNFNKLREKADDNERKAIAAERKALEAEQRVYELQNALHAQPASEPEYPVADDDFVDHKTIKKYQSEQEQKIAELEDKFLKVSLKAEYPDFDKVLSSENLNKFAKEYPDIARTVIESNVGKYDQLKTTYTLMKKLSLTDNQPEQNLEKINSNMNKVKVTNTLSKTSSELNRAHQFETGRITAEEKAARWKIMKENSAKC